MPLRYLLPLFLLASPAYAVDFSQPLINAENSLPFCDVALKEGEECPADKIITLARLAKISLYAADDKADGETKYKRAELAQSLTGTGDLKLKKDEREMIKSTIGKFWPPAYVKAAWDALEK